MFAQGWYPFVGIDFDIVSELVGHATEGWQIDDLLDKIEADLRRRLPGYIASWKEHPVFQGHMDLIEKAASHFLNGDPMSCAAMLYPRIEGLLRTHARHESSNSNPTTCDLAPAAVATARRVSLVMRDRLEQYLGEVYFKRYVPSGATTTDVSRHSVSHGEVAPSALDRKAAIVALLIIQQLRLCFRPAPGDVRDA
jgi:hypothetical protein